MGPFLLALVPLFSALTQPLKDWFAFKQQYAKAEQDYKLAVLQTQSTLATQQMVSDTTDLGNRLNATTKDFKQTTFWFLCIPILFTITCPNRAAVMWQNFTLVPEFFQWLFLSVYSSIWGIPIVKGGYGAITELLTARRDFKLQKETIKASVINEKTLADELRRTLFTKGMTEAQWNAIRVATEHSLENKE